MTAKTRDEQITIAAKAINAGKLARLGHVLPVSEGEISNLSPQSLQDLISKLGGLVT